MRLSRLGVLAALLGSGICAAVGFALLRVPTAPEPPARVVFVSYVDTPDDRRGDADFQVFAGALRRLDPDMAGRVTLDFVQASVTGGTSIGEAMQRIVALRPAAVVATSDDVLDAARAVTDSIPVVFASHADPVAAGYVKSIAAPGVARTGFTYHLPITPKMIEMLADAFPAIRRVGIIADPSRMEAAAFEHDLRAIGDDLGIEVAAFVATRAQHVEAALRSPRGRTVDAWYVPVGEALWNDEAAVLDLMRRSGKPTLFERERWARRAGGMSYEPKVRDPFGILASQVLLILHGTDAATIPVERPSDFELAVSLPNASAARPAKTFLKRANKILGDEPGPPR